MARPRFAPTARQYRRLIDELAEWDHHQVSSRDWDWVTVKVNIERLHAALGRRIVPFAIADLQAEAPCRRILDLLDEILPQVLAHCDCHLLELPFSERLLERRTLWLRWWDEVGSHERWER